NAALLITADERGTAPLASAPEGASVLPVSPIALGPVRFELDEKKTRKLATWDPALGEAFERFQVEAKIQDATHATKLGGNPVWVQQPTTPRTKDGRSYRFLCELDFDGSLGGRVRKTWTRAGLFGCLLVFVHPDEEDAVAFWQYT